MPRVAKMDMVHIRTSKEISPPLPHVAQLVPDQDSRLGEIDNDIYKLSSSNLGHTVGV